MLILWRDTRGIAVALVAVMLMALIGFTGLAVETGLWFVVKRYNQSAADAAALSGTMELAAGKSYSDICGLAKIAAEANGYNFLSTCPVSSFTTQAQCTTELANGSGYACVNDPPLWGSRTNAVEVILTQRQHTLFAGVPFSGAGSALSGVTINARAVAAITNISTCMIAVSTSGTDFSYNGGGNNTINVPNCAFYSNSTDSKSIDLKGNFKWYAGAISTVGNYSSSGSAGVVSPAITTNAAALSDPYASVTVTPPSSTLPCTNINLSSGTATLASGTRYGQISVTGGTLIVPDGAAYYLDGSCSGGGNLSITGGTIQQGTGGGCGTSCTGVTFVLTAQTGGSAGSITINGNNGTASGSLSAPTTSGYLSSASASTGLLFFQDPKRTTACHPSKSCANTIATGCATGQKSISLTGAIDTEITEDDLYGNASACTSCTELIAANYVFDGNVGMDTSGCANLGTKTGQVSKVALAE